MLSSAAGAGTELGNCEYAHFDLFLGGLLRGVCCSWVTVGEIETKVTQPQLGLGLAELGKMI